MLDHVCVFTKGGSLLWALSFVALKGDPINTLIRACLLEDRAAQSSFEYIIPSGGTYALKWSLNNVRPLLSLTLCWFRCCITQKEMCTECFRIACQQLCVAEAA